MKRLASSLLVVLLVIAWLAPVASGPAQENKPKPRKTPPNPVYAPITDVAGLPRVLLIGDSISIGYTLAVRELLADKANVHRPPTNCGPTIQGVKQIDAWLGDGRWDVIHFNFGLHDLKIMDEQGIVIDDLYAFAQPQLPKIQLPNNVHFSPDGSKVLARQVVVSIEKTLK